MSENGIAESFMEEHPVNENRSSQSAMADMASSNNTGYRTSRFKDGASEKRSTTNRGRNGKKWVGVNWQNKEQMKKANNGSMPYSDALITSPFPHSDEWSEDQLPEILFYIKPPKSEFEGQPVSLLQENGEVVKVGKHGKPVRDFPILPRRISLEVPGWLVETWRRLDPRITYPDILDRQIEDPIQCLKKLDKNALQNHCRRECRMVLGMWTNYERREVPHRTDVEAIECLSHQNIMLNTILNVCPIRQDRLTKLRLIQRSQDGCGKYYSEPCEVSEVNLYQTTFPIDHFVLKSEIAPDWLHSMDRSMLAAWELSLILQERARHHGVSHWKKLADSCRPVSWFDRTVNKRTENDTFDGGCSVCTWIPGKDQDIHRNWIKSIKLVSSRSTNPKSSTKNSSSLTSKRRKLKDGTKQEVSTESTKSSAEECDCCKEVDRYDSWSRSEQYPSERFLRGEIRSYFRDADLVEARADTTINDNTNHGSINEGSQHSVEAEDWDTSLSSSFRTPSASEPISDPNIITLPEWQNIDPALFEMSGNEIDFNGIGDHLAEEHEPQYVRDEATEMTVEDRFTYDSWSAFPPDSHLREIIDEKWVSPEDFSALWNVVNDSESPSLERLSTLYSADSDTIARPYPQTQLDPLGDSPSWYQSDLHELNAVRRTQSEPPPVEHQHSGQSLRSSDCSHSANPPSSGDIPGLATSFETESESFSSDALSLHLRKANLCNPTEVEKPESIFNTHVVGRFAFNDNTTTSNSWSSSRGFLRELESPLVTDNFLGSKTWQERVESACQPTSNRVSGQAMHKWNSEFVASPTTKYYDDEDEDDKDDLYGDSLLPTDEPISGFY